MKDSEIMEKINVTINAWRVVLFLCCTRSMCSLWGCSVCLWPSHSLTHTHRCTSSPFTPFPRMIFNAHSKKKKKEKGQNTQTLGLSLPTTLSPFQHVFISVMSHTNTQRPLPDLDAPTQPLSSSFQSYAHSMQNTSAHTHFPASDDSGLSSQMLCIFFST